ncbi:Dihydrofolate reductase [Arachidicoccus rhizosphaerae]|jgi:dihydrofolate reductase|uniref:Dihydrofolate reductase n=1 Tax=Arachidicoccus rhizosphaerae TaxID=551991 RepID=A0A1H3VIG3_9BACT|nr:dihydrofolate reductase family protein [Arachidicoccus rhizosphaerae]SDZ74559.1 Dihydrofolate reductase [Arachidicoccus rhizosphaerae]
MGNIVLFMHVSLDGYAAGTKGEMDWIHVDAEIFDFVGERVGRTNTALYGRVTFQMMESYWPTAADQPGASHHDRVHSAWYKNVQKVVLSTTLDASAYVNTTVISQDYAEKLRQLKKRTVGEILLFGSPTAAHSLLAEDLIDEYWLFINPVVLGAGIPVFKNVQERQLLKPLGTKVFSSGVVCMRHEVQFG